MRGHRGAAPDAGSTLADLANQTRGGGAVIVILARDIGVSGADRLPVELVTGEAVVALDQFSAGSQRVLTARAPLLKVLHADGDSACRDRPAAQRSILAIGNPNGVADRNTGKEESFVAAEEIDADTRGLIAGDDLNVGGGMRATGISRGQRRRIR